MHASHKTLQVDLLNGNILTALLRFALPLLFSSLFQQLYNTMDTVIVGHTLGESALAAMGAAAPVYDLLIGFALGIGNGLSIVAARNYGAGKDEQLKKAVAASLVIGAGISGMITLFACSLLTPFLTLLKTPAEIFAQTHSYIFIILLFTAVMFAYNLCAGLLNAIGNSFMPLLFLILSSALNIGLDYLLITQFHMGIRGAAVATVMAQGISVCLCLSYILSKAKLLLPQRTHFSFDKKLYGEMAAQGFSMGFMSCFVYAGTAILQTGINDLGYLVIAGHTAARKLLLFGGLAFYSVANALSTFVSQNYGAGKIGRIRKAVAYTYLYNAVGTIIVTVLFYRFAPSLVALISGSTEAVVIGNGSRYLQIAAPFYFILGFVNSSRNSLQAIGSKILPIVSSIIELIGKILFVILFIPKYGYDAVIFCEPIIWCFMAAELMCAFWLHPNIRKGAALKHP